MVDLVLLHTSDTHIARFDALRDQIAPTALLRHDVRPDWLSLARDNGSADDLRATFTAFVAALNAPVLCTCTTLGPLADAAGAIRIDRPMMQKAAGLEGPITLAYCLESTRIPSRTLLAECLRDAGRPSKVRMLDLSAAWPAFEAGDHTAFTDYIAAEIRIHLTAFAQTKAIVLAQASMSDAASMLENYAVPVLASPKIALRTALGL